jgi:hypothetical protein
MRLAHDCVAPQRGFTDPLARASRPARRSLHRLPLLFCPLLRRPFAPGPTSVIGDPGTNREPLGAI